MDSSKLYSTVFQLLPIPALVLAADAPRFTIIDANSNFKNIVKGNPKNLIGKSFFDVFPFKPDDPSISEGKVMFQSLLTVLESGKENDLGVQNYIARNPESGKVESQYYHPRNIPVADENGKVVNIIHAVNNVTTLVQQQSELKQSENRFKNLVENSGDAIFIYNREIKPIYATSSVEQILGYTVEEIYNTDLLDSIHPDDLPDLEKLIKTSLENPGIPLAVPPGRIRHKNGSYRWIEGTLTNMLNNPSIGGIVDNFRDVTDRIEAAEEIYQAKKRMEGIIKTIDGIFWEAGVSDFVFTFVSPQTSEILGYQPEEWIGVQDFWNSKIHPEDRHFAVSFCQTETLKGKNHAFEYRMLKADGTYIWIRDVVTVVKKNGKPVSLRGLMLDITDRKELELQLKQAYEIAQTGNWSYDPETNELYWSEYVKHIFEVEPDYNPDPDSSADFYFDDTQKELISRITSRAVENNSPFDVETKIRTAKGNEKWIRTVGVPELKDGKLIKVFGTNQDITRRKKAQLQLEETEQKLRDVVEHSTNLFYTHDTDGIITFLSPQSKDFLGYKPEEAMRRWTDFVTDHPENELGIKHTMRAIQTGKPQPPYNIQLQHADGSLLWAEVNEAPIVKDGKTVGIVGSLTDKTDRKLFEEKLLSANKKLTTAQSIARVGSWELDIANKNRIFWSEMTREIIGVDDGFEPSIDSVFDFYEPESKELIQDAVYNAIKTGVPFDLELLIKTAQGENKWIRCIAEPEITDGKCTKLTGSIQDIHEKKTSEIELDKRRSFIETTLDNLPIGISVHRIDDGKSTLVNKQFSDIYGWPANEMRDVDQFFKNVYPNTDYREKVKNRILTDMQSGDPDKMQWMAIQITTKSGEKRIINAKNIPLPDQNLMISTVVDVTKEKKAERERVRILESISDAFFAIDKNWNITYFNREAENQLKTSSDEIIGKNIRSVIHTDRHPGLFEKFQETTDNKLPSTFEYHHDELNTWFEFSTYPAESGLSIFFRDISDRKNAECQLKQLNSELEKHARELAISNAELEQFAYVASHDLQEPLRMVSSFLTQLDKKYHDKLDDKARRYIHFAVDGADRMRQIILDLLNYSRVGKKNYPHTEISLDRLLKEVTLLEQAAIQETNAQVTWDQLPLIQGAEIPIQQLFQNLVNNAIKYHTPGVTPLVHISCKDLESKWQFTIQDNGIGINEEFQDNIFNIFQRLHTQDEYTGTGIGLAIAKKIVENHQGSMWVKSKEGEGSSFHFTIKKPD